MITWTQFGLICGCSLVIFPAVLMADHGPTVLYALGVIAMMWLRAAYRRVSRIRLRPRLRRIWS